MFYTNIFWLILDQMDTLLETAPPDFVTKFLVIMKVAIFGQAIWNPTVLVDQQTIRSRGSFHSWWLFCHLPYWQFKDRMSGSGERWQKQHPGTPSFSLRTNSPKTYTYLRAADEFPCAFHVKYGPLVLPPALHCHEAIPTNNEPPWPWRDTRRPVW